MFVLKQRCVDAKDLDCLFLEGRHSRFQQKIRGDNEIAEPMIL